jgi:hypothetical protein
MNKRAPNKIRQLHILDELSNFDADAHAAPLKPADSYPAAGTTGGTGAFTEAKASDFFRSASEGPASVEHRFGARGSSPCAPNT